MRGEWKDSFTVGNEELDAQHRKLLDLINEIGDLADAQNTVKSATFGALNAMIRYA
jgi:hemerythrin